jgi:hypothetical protein
MIKTPVAVVVPSEIHDLYYVRDADGDRLTNKLVRKSADEIATALNERAALLELRDACRALLDTDSKPNFDAIIAAEREARQRIENALALMEASNV